jgi:hypothetical protein
MGCGASKNKYKADAEAPADAPAAKAPEANGAAKDPPKAKDPQEEKEYDDILKEAGIADDDDLKKMEFEDKKHLALQFKNMKEKGASTFKEAAGMDERQKEEKEYDDILKEMGIAGDDDLKNLPFENKKHLALQFKNMKAKGASTFKEAAAMDADKLKEEVLAETLAETVVKTDEEYKGPAPYLHEYHMKIIKQMDGMMTKMSDPDYAFSLACDEDAKAADEKEEADVKAELKELVEKSFKLHDTKGKDDLLDAEEAAVFFQNYSAEAAVMIEGVCKLTIGMMFKQQIIQIVEMGIVQEGSKEEFKEELKAKVEEVLGQVKEKVKAMEVDYLEHKEERNAAAFKVTDTNGDGTLNLSEAIAILVPGEGKNSEFTRALGFNVEDVMNDLEDVVNDSMG